MVVSLPEGGLQVGAQPGHGRLDLRVALLAQLLLHFQRAAGEALRTNLQRGSCIRHGDMGGSERESQTWVAHVTGHKIKSYKTQ